MNVVLDDSNENVNSRKLNVYIGIGIFGYLFANGLAYTIKEFAKDLLIIMSANEDIFTWGVEITYWVLLIFFIYALLSYSIRKISSSEKGGNLVLTLFLSYIAIQVVQFAYAYNKELLYSIDHAESRIKYLKSSIDNIYFAYTNPIFFIIGYLIIWRMVSKMVK